MGLHESRSTIRDIPRMEGWKFLTTPPLSIEVWNTNWSYVALLTVNKISKILTRTTKSDDALNPQICKGLHVRPI